MLSFSLQSRFFHLSVSICLGVKNKSQANFFGRVRDGFETSSRRVRDEFETSSRRVRDQFETSSRRVRDQFETGSAGPPDRKNQFLRPPPPPPDQRPLDATIFRKKAKSKIEIFVVRAVTSLARARARALYLLWPRGARSCILAAKRTILHFGTEVHDLAFWPRSASSAVLAGMGTICRFGRDGHDLPVWPGWA